MAASISAEYPDFWPETVRGLIVHSARWTDAMWSHFRQRNVTKTKRTAFVRRYGFGVPTLERCLQSAEDSLTLIAQGTISPFKDGKTDEMHVYELPWPVEELKKLGEAEVKLRITLSYFVEPKAGRRGFKAAWQYASHGLHFEIRGPTESTDTFRKRMNKKQLADEEKRPSFSNSSEWFLGERQRNRGSLHSDIMTGTAADIAERGAVGVFPIGGWWKEQSARDRSVLGVRYALLVSIETEAVDAELWTEVDTQIQNLTQVPVA